MVLKFGKILGHACEFFFFFLVVVVVVVGGGGERGLEVSGPQTDVHLFI